MKVTGTKANNNATSSLIDLEIAGLPRKTQTAIKNEVGEYLKEQILLAVGDATSPVKGEIFKALSKDYKKHKEDDGGVGIPNLEKGGDMLNALDFKLTKDGIEIGVFGSEAPKADGHNKFSGKVNPYLKTKRRFLPDESQNFKPAIVKEVERIIGEQVMDVVDEDDLKLVETKSQLYDLFKYYMPDATRSEVRQFILGNQKITQLLMKYELLELL